jgi:predicted NBD/HSP70 family sugar kinase
MTGLVFDLGGTHLRSAVMTSRDGLAHVTKVRLATVADGLAAAEVWRDVRERLFRYVREHIPTTAAGSPIVVSFPGPIDRQGRILQAPTLTGADADITDFRQELQRAFDRPAFIINDLSAAAWYLSTVTAGRFLVVTVSSGIGSKLYDPAIGVFDETAFAGEIGHTVVDFSAEAVRCDCGGRGHLGAIASGRGIERLARESARRSPDAFAASACVTHHHATAATLTNEAHLVPALRGGDLWATDVVRSCSQALARALVYSIVVGGLQRVVIIGGFALAAGDAYLGLLRDAARECCDYELFRDGFAERLSLGAVHEEVCLLGAGVYGGRAAGA